MILTDSNVSVNALVDMAGLFRLDDTIAKRVVGEVESGTRDWKRVAGTFNVDHSEIELMRAAFENDSREAVRAWIA